MTVKIVLDVDTGTDDAVAIMLAALHPQIELEAVTTVNGNVEVEHCTDNTLRVLEWIGKGDIPVYEGMHRPIVRLDFPVPRAEKRDPGVHMKSIPAPGAKGAKRRLSAPAFLAQTFAREPGKTLVPVGPLSNVAAAMALDDNFAQNVGELMIMGGAVNKSNITPSAEFNIWADPEAAAIVFRGGFKKITLVPLDATHEALVSLDQCKQLRGLGTPAGKLSADLIEHRIRGYQANQPTGVPETAPVHDALCIAALVDRSVITTKLCNVEIETAGEFTVGRTVVDHEKRTKRAPNSDVAFHADREKFVGMLLEIFARS